jgi:deoxycytidylate deaminase
MSDDYRDMIEVANSTAAKSPNRGRKVGAVLLNASGDFVIASCNTIAAGVKDREERHAKPECY